MISKNARLKYYLNNAPATAPEDIESTEIIADFSEDNIQANITAQGWTFYNQDAQTIIDYINAGNIYEGLPFKIETYNNTNNLTAFNGLLDLTNGYEDNFSDSVRVTANIVKKDGLNIFFDRLESNSFGYLESIGIFNNSSYTDLDYLVEKKVNLVDELTTSIILYMMSKELITQIKEIGRLAVEVAGHLSGGISGSVAAFAVAVAALAIQIAYAASIIVLILNLSKQLFETFLPPVRTHKTINLYTAMERVCSFLSYTFNTSITELNDLYYLPSNPNIEEADLQNFLSVSSGTPSGIPHATDPHYNCASFFELMKKQFNAKFAVVNGVVEFHPEGAPYWLKNSTFVMPSARPKTKTTNASDLNASKVITFAYDLQDEYTVDNYTGTTFEVQTTPIGITDSKANLIKGFQEVTLDVCLGTRKTELSGLEKALQEVGGVIDGLINFFGGNSNLAAQVTQRVGLLKQSTNWQSMPKILKLNGRKLAADYRATYSAEALYNSFHAYDSFVANNFNGQKLIYNDVKIPFGLNDFVSLINNSYFQDSNNNTGKVISIKWKPTQDTATVSYYIRTPYTTKLEETHIIP